ncbi:MAG: hypothetical protein OEV49_15025 [candidate division Zixibacteria bacterium]|nr:hypothetical protein [candidate division Zixibacteria bacterium]MDH3936476.1 hypothetical protein [candidate division Zixibacteria bacterium]MDH4032929.1 hypothetical protein [candidate division Zixibacteria bacterium]
MVNWRTGKFWLGVYMMAMTVALIYGILELWYVPDGWTGIAWADRAPVFCDDFQVLRECRLLFLVILTGALGSIIHAATSFATYVGNKSLTKSWYWWYVLRPFIGAAISIILYFCVRGGILLTTMGSDDPNMSPYGVGALSGLAGMFSKKAADKLREVFEALFKTSDDKGDAERANKLGDVQDVSDLMLPTKSITALHLTQDENEDVLPLRKLNDLFAGVVTRIPILENDAVKYIVHQSLLFKFISRVDKGASTADQVLKKSLTDFLEFNNMRAMVENSLAFVSIDHTIDDAKNAMDAVPNCQDVFVTQSGKPDEPMLGWLMNTEIAKRLKA